MRFWKRSDDVEARLRAHRPQARPEFVRSLAQNVDPRSARRTPVRLAILGAGTATALAALSSFGGFGYVGSAVAAAKKPAVIVRDLVSDNEKQSAPAPIARSAADDEYPEKTAICHRTGSSTNPYVLIVVSNSALNAHREHEPKGNPPRSDIVPAPTTGCPS